MDASLSVQKTLVALERQTLTKAVFFSIFHLLVFLSLVSILPIKCCSYFAKSNYWSFVFVSVFLVASFLLMCIWVETIMSGFANSSYISNSLRSEMESLSGFVIYQRSLLQSWQIFFSLNLAVFELYSFASLSFCLYMISDILSFLKLLRVFGLYLPTWNAARMVRSFCNVASLFAYCFFLPQELVLFKQFSDFCNFLRLLSRILWNPGTFLDGRWLAKNELWLLTVNIARHNDNRLKMFCMVSKRLNQDV